MGGASTVDCRRTSSYSHQRAGVGRIDDAEWATGGVDEAEYLRWNLNRNQAVSRDGCLSLNCQWNKNGA